MNPRIRQLMIQAISDVDSINDPETRRMYIPNCFAEKFAELVVKECVHTVRNRGGMCGALASNWIEEHFGVEE